MRRSVSLKEFSTTPTVSCMLRKDGNNVASSDPPQQTSVQRSAAPAGVQASKVAAPSPNTGNGIEQEGMWEME